MSTVRHPMRPFARGVIGLPTGPEAAAFDRSSIEGLGVSEAALMESAGRAAAAVLQRLYPGSGPVVGLVGAGNNGGDALVLLRTLAAWGRPVRAIHVSDRTDPDPLTHGWTLETVLDSALSDPAAWRSALSDADVVVDGILGTGIQGPPRDRQARAIDAANAARAPVLALDLPSGVDASTGRVPGTAIRASSTVGFGWPKLGSLLSPGREHAGRVIGVEVGFPPSDGRSFGQIALTAGWARSAVPRRAPDTHKNAVGALLLVAGQEGMAGAAVLAGRAAIRAGVGFLRIASVSSNREVLQSSVPEAVFVDAGEPGALRDAQAASDAVAVGPGLGTGPAQEALLRSVLADGSTPIVLDADALNLIGRDGGPTLGALASSRPVLVTPHPGEMERLTGADREEILSDRPGNARRLASETGVVVLLKGLPSVVAEPAGSVMVDTIASSDLAQAGMGDVLAGAAGSFLAQGASPSDAGGLALFHVGRAAVLADRGAGMSVEDVLEQLPSALREEGAGVTDLDLPFVFFDHDAPR